MAQWPTRANSAVRWKRHLGTDRVRQVAHGGGDMSYTLYRISPSDRSGGPFDISYHGWHVLVRAIETFGPEEIVKKCLWRYNDEMGLEAQDAVCLADALDAAL